MSGASAGYLFVTKFTEDALWKGAVQLEQIFKVMPKGWYHQTPLTTLTNVAQPPQLLRDPAMLFLNKVRKQCWSVVGGLLRTCEPNVIALHAPVNLKFALKLYCKMLTLLSTNDVVHWAVGKK